MQICIPKGMEQKGREFYCEILGLKEIEKPQELKDRGGFWLEVADIQLHIGTEEMPGASKRHPAFEIENTAEVRSYLESKGVRTKDDIAVAGLARFSVFDFWDNRIELFEKL